MNWFKRTLRTFGLSRKINNSAYKGAETGRLYWDWIVSPLTADQEVKQDKRRLTARARDLAKNDSTIKSFHISLVANVIGPKGITMQMQARNKDGTLAKNINDAIELAWRHWGYDVSVDGKFDLVQFQHLALKTVATDGEVFIRKVIHYPNKYGFALQLIDPDLIDHEYNIPRGTNQNEIRLGIEINEWGRSIAYWVYTQHPNEPILRERKRIRIPAEEIIHIYLPDRINQTRGVTWLNSAMLSLRMLDGYCEAELMASRTAAAKMGWLQYKDASSFDPPDPNKPTRIEASPGTVETLPPGLEFIEWSPQHPSTAFPDFIKANLRKIATGLGVSYNVLANDLEGVNYSSLRSGLLVEREYWKILQEWWIKIFLKQIYLEWLQATLLSGGLVSLDRDYNKYLHVKWVPRGWPWVDPLKDVQASILAIQNGLESRTDVLAEKGKDFEDTLNQLVEEKKLAEQSGLSFPNSIQPESKPGTKTQMGLFSELEKFNLIESDAGKGNDNGKAKSRKKQNGAKVSRRSL